MILSKMCTISSLTASFANQHSYTGDLTIKLDSGLQVRIPNNQLIVPDRNISPSGEIIANASSPNIVINPIKEINANDQLHLGRQFLSAAYVMINEDSSSFTLWKANPTLKSYVMGVDKRNDPILSNCTIHVTMTSESKLSKGAIAGIAVAAVAAVLIIALVAYRSSKKGEKDRAWMNEPPDGQAQAHAKTGPADIPLQNLSASELDVFSPQTPGELSAENERQELAELPARNSESEVRVKPKS
jgi:hypothetical protein